MASSWQGRLQAAVVAVLAAHEATGAVIAVAPGDQPPDVLAIGADAAGRPLAADSLFPLASVTKLAAALVILRLVDAERLAVDADLARYVPEAAAARPGVTLRHLLAHTAGLPYDLPPGAVPYGPGVGWPQLAEAALRTPLDAAPGERVVYSNIGYSLLALVIERVTGQTWPAALTALVLEPLGIEAYLGVEPPRPPARLSDIRDATAGTPLETMNSPYWRSRGLPSSGLVATAAGALALVRAFRGQPADFLRPDDAGRGGPGPDGRPRRGHRRLPRMAGMPMGARADAAWDEAGRRVARRGQPHVLRHGWLERVPGVGRPGRRPGLVDPRDAQRLQRLDLPGLPSDRVRHLRGPSLSAADHEGCLGRRAATAAGG